MAKAPSAEPYRRLCLERGFLTSAQATAVRTAQKEAAQRGTVKSFLLICLEKNFLTREQCAEIERRARAAVSERVVRLKSLGGFRLLEKVGEGAMGVVFKARQESLDRVVALKLLAPRLAKNPVFIARFMREARAAAALNHPNIVQGIDVGSDQGFHYFAMEFVEGETAAQRLKRRGRPLPVKEVLEIGRQTAAALAHAHRKGLLHRDVKPDNLMLVPAAGETNKTTFTVKLMDLGLAKETDEDEDAALTRSGATVGTPYYISPEQARGRKDLGPPADLYSLGCTLYHLAVGRPPFAEGSSAVILAAHLSEKPPDPRRFRSDLPAKVAVLLLKLLRKKPAERFPNAENFAAAVSDIQSGTEPAGRNTGRTTGAVGRRTRGTKGLHSVSGPHGRRATTGPRRAVVVRLGEDDAPLLPEDAADTPLRRGLIAAGVLLSAAALSFVVYLMVSVRGKTSNRNRDEKQKPPRLVEKRPTIKERTPPKKNNDAETGPKSKPPAVSPPSRLDDAGRRVAANLKAAEQLARKNPDDLNALYAAWTKVSNDSAAKGTPSGRKAKAEAKKTALAAVRKVIAAAKKLVAEKNYDAALAKLTEEAFWAAEPAAATAAAGARKQAMEKAAAEGEKLLGRVTDLENAGKTTAAEKLCAAAAKLKYTPVAEKAAARLPALREAAAKIRAEQSKQARKKVFALALDIAAALQKHEREKTAALLDKARHDDTLAPFRKELAFLAEGVAGEKDFLALLAHTLKESGKTGRTLPADPQKTYYKLSGGRIHFRFRDIPAGSSMSLKNFSWPDLFLMAGLDEKNGEAAAKVVGQKRLCALAGFAVLLGKTDLAEKVFMARAEKLGLPQAAEKAAFWKEFTAAYGRRFPDEQAKKIFAELKKLPADGDKPLSPAQCRALEKLLAALRSPPLAKTSFCRKRAGQLRKFAERLETEKLRAVLKDVPLAKLVHGKVVNFDRRSLTVELEYDFSSPEQLKDFTVSQARWEIDEKRGRLKTAGAEHDALIWLKIPFVGDRLTVSFTGAAPTDFNCLLGPEIVPKTTAGYSFRFGRGTTKIGVRETVLLNSAEVAVCKSLNVLPWPERENRVLIEKIGDHLNALLNGRQVFSLRLPPEAPEFRHVALQTWERAWYDNLRVRGRLDPNWLTRVYNEYIKARHKDKKDTE